MYSARQTYDFLNFVYMHIQLRNPENFSEANCLVDNPIHLSKLHEEVRCVKCVSTSENELVLTVE